ncbi:amidohydrolase family protein [Bordetella petrii]|uniref:amidohydrolase family protein n=1 Tax=Bordetella petrii TaxID=94624 RepID=UPI001A974FB9|nr:amidohydrolase family protein [Bordetella petrii]MBO1111563.1 amidohydrolase [Bordetella petrii]
MTTVRKIAFEEHYTAVGFGDYSQAFVQHLDPDTAAGLGARLTDFGPGRLELMDRAGIDYVILSQTGPGVQGERDAAVALKRARENNDFLAAQVAQRPDRYGAFATLPMHDAATAAAELQRSVEQLGFKGALVNGHTNGVYYDDPAYDVFWERLQALDVPLYLHPFYAYTEPHAYSGHPELAGATWGWGVETATHTLRLLFGGVFDRYPGVKIILGHMGEGLPFQRWRFDSRFAAYPYGVKLRRKPSEYIGSNVLITTSGVCSHATLVGAIAEMGAEAVMFSIDYPYESTELAVEFIETAPLDAATLELVCRGNAQRLFKL